MAVGIMVMIQSTWALSPEPAREGCRLWWSHQPKWLKNGLSYFHSGGPPDFIIYSPILTCPHTLKRIQVINILPHTKNFKSNPSHSGNKSTILETSSSNLYINKQKDHQTYAQISTYHINWHEKKQTFQRRVSLKISSSRGVRKTLYLWNKKRLV